MADDARSEIESSYTETDGERRLTFVRENRTATLAQNIDGYAMVAVRDEQGERERYYGFEMALDHAAELLGVEPAALSIPDGAADMGM